MATTPANPIDPAAPETVRSMARAMLDIQKTQESIGDLSSEMVESYKKILAQIGNYGSSMKNISSFSREILKDTRAMGMIQEEISSQVRSQEIAMLKYKFYEQEATRANSIRIDAIKKEAEIEEKLNQSSSLSHKNKLKYIEEEFKRTKVNTDYLSGNAKTIEEAKQAHILAGIDKFKKMKADVLESSDEFKSFAGAGKDYFKGIEEMAMRRAESEAEQADTAKENLNLVYSTKKYLEDSLKLNRMIQTSVKMQVGYFKQLEDTGFAALGPLSGMVKNSVEFVGVWKKAGKEVAIAQLSVVAIQGSLSTTVKFIMAAVSRFKELDLAAEKFRTDTGFSSDQMSVLRGTVENLSVRFSHMGISVEELYNSAKALTDVFGRTSLLTETALENVSKLKVNLGVAVEDSAGVLSNFQGLGGVSEEIAMNVIKTSAVLSEKIGVPFRLVMKDVANASDDVLTTIGATPGKLMKAAIAARAMGLELNKLGAQQKTLLNYSDSITSELEASALLGQNITFMKARQLAFEGKAKESMIETLNVVKQMGNFNAMTPYQRAAVAKATGMELKDLTKALAVDKARNSIYFGTNKAARDRLIAQEAALENLEKETDMTGEALMDERERVLEQRKMQGLLTTLKNTMTSLFVSIGTLLEPIVRLLATFATGLNYIAGGFGELTASLDKFSKGLSTAIGLAIIGLGTLASYMSFKWASGMLTKSIGSLVGSIMGAARDKIATEMPGLGAAVASSAKDAGATVAGKAAAEAAPSVSSKVTDAAAKTEKVGKGVNYGGGIKVFLRNFTDGLSYFGRPSVMKGYLGIALMGASLLPFIGSMYLFTQIDWAKAVDGIEALAIVSTIAGIIGLGAPLLIKGAGALAILGFALLPLAITFAIVGKASQEFSTGIVVAKNAIVEILEKASPLNILAFGAAIAGMTYALAAAAPVAAIAGAGLLTMTLGLSSLAFAISIVAPNAEKFGKGMKQGVNALQSLATMNFISLFTNMTRLGDQLKSSTGTFGDFVSGVFGKDTITKIESLSKMSKDITPTAAAIAMMTSSFHNFGVVDNFANAIGRLATSFVSLNTAVAALDTNKLSEVRNSVGTAANVPATTQPSPATTSTDITKIEQVLDRKLSEFVKAMGNIQIMMDAAVVGKAVIRTNGTQ